MHGTKKGNSTGTTRCVPGDVMAAAEALTPQAKRKVTDIGFSNMLNLKLKRLGTREGILFLMLLSDVSLNDESFIIRVSEHSLIDVTAQGVGSVLVPVGNGKEHNLGKPKDHRAPYDNLCNELIDQGYNVLHRVKQTKNGAVKYRFDKKIKIEHVIDYIRKSKEDTDKQVYLFFCVLVTRLLLPTLSNYVIPRTAWMCSNFELMRNLNWCHLICKDLKDKFSTWQKKENKVNATIEGCTVVLLVSEHL